MKIQKPAIKICSEFIEYNSNKKCKILILFDVGLLLCSAIKKNKQ